MDFTGRAVIVHEASGFAGYGAEVAARLTEQCFFHLEAPILRVTGLDMLDKYKETSLGGLALNVVEC